MDQERDNRYVDLDEGVRIRGGTKQAFREWLKNRPHVRRLFGRVHLGDLKKELNLYDYPDTNKDKES